ncbi:MAG: putative quinol monooxygenase [Proteobacteria bacterium]|jgi:quinol monooxygenase YgiN|nr:putative quinol monooxygenase [Pseudomonadota bacterium]
MRIIVAGTVDVDPAKRAQVLIAGLPHIVAARAEKGCIHYVWSADNVHPGRIYVFEEWESQADLAAHLKAPPYINMRDTIGSFGILGASTQKYRIDHAEPVYDDKGVPRADFFTKPA